MRVSIGSLYAADDFSFIIVIDCCASPTIFSGPTISPDAYSYNLGTDPTLQIPLNGQYGGDNSCCSVASSAPSISPADLANLFTLSADQLINSVYSDVVDPNAGPGTGLYTITYSAPVHPYGCHA